MKNVLKIWLGRWIYSLKIRIIGHVREEGPQIGHWYPVGVGIGIACALSLFTPYLEGICGAITIYIHYRQLVCRKSSFSSKEPAPHLIFCLCLIGGMLWTHGHALYRGRCFFVTPFKAKITGPILGIQAVRFGHRIDVDTPLGPLQLWTRQGKTPLYVGDWITGYAHLKSPPYRATPQSFDNRWMAFWGGNVGVGQIISWKKHAASTHLQSYIQKRMDHSLQQFPYPLWAEIDRKLIMAQGVIPPDVRTLFADSGLSHVLAVSGLHMTIVAGFILVLLRRCLVLIMPWAWHAHVKICTSLVALPFLWLYAWQCWSAISARRAVFMSTLGLISVFLFQPYYALRALMVAGLLVLLITPESLFSISFQMSFMSVLLLIHTTTVQRYQHFIKQSSWKQKALKKLQTLGITLRLSFITSLYATQIPGVTHIGLGIISNLWVIPYMGLILMPVCFCHYLLVICGCDPPFIRLLCAYSIGGLMKMAEIGACLTQWVHIPLPQPSPLTLSLFTLSVLWGTLWQGSWRRWNRVGLGITILSLAVPWHSPLDPIAPLYNRKCPMKRVPSQCPEPLSH